jgi:DNA-binding CsgD family transcriptional regulator
VRPDDELIDLIYSAALGERDWRELAFALDEGVPNGGSMLFYHDVDNSSGTVSVSGNIDQSWVDDFDRYYGSINPFMPVAATRPVGLGVIADDMLSSQEFERSEFYQDFLRHSDRHSAVGITVLREAGRSLLLSTMTSLRDPDLKRPLANRLTMLVPHLRRGFDIYRRRLNNETDRELTATLDAFGVGVVVVAPNGNLRSASEVAGRIIADGRIATVTPSGRFMLRDERANATLGAMLSPDACGRTVSITIADVSMTLRATSSADLLARIEGPSIVIIMQPRAVDLSTVDLGPVIATFGLTAAEERVLRGVLEGGSLAEIGERLSRSRETVKSQMRSIFAKTGVTRREALVALALRLGS